MKISKVRPNLYRSAHLLGDLNAVQKGTVGKRIVKRTAGQQFDHCIVRVVIQHISRRQLGHECAKG